MSGGGSGNLDFAKAQQESTFQQNIDQWQHLYGGQKLDGSYGRQLRPSTKEAHGRVFRSRTDFIQHFDLHNRGFTEQAIDDAIRASAWYDSDKGDEFEEVGQTWKKLEYQRDLRALDVKKTGQLEAWQKKWDRENWEHSRDIAQLADDRAQAGYDIRKTAHGLQKTLIGDAQTQAKAYEDTLYQEAEAEYNMVDGFGKRRLDLEHEEAMSELVFRRATANAKTTEIAGARKQNENEKATAEDAAKLASARATRQNTLESSLTTYALDKAATAKTAGIERSQAEVNRAIARFGEEGTERTLAGLELSKALKNIDTELSKGSTRTATSTKLQNIATSLEGNRLEQAEIASNVELGEIAGRKGIDIARAESERLQIRQGLSGTEATTIIDTEAAQVGLASTYADLDQKQATAAEVLRSGIELTELSTEEKLLKLQDLEGQTGYNILKSQSDAQEKAAELDFKQQGLVTKEEEIRAEQAYTQQVLEEELAAVNATYQVSNVKNLIERATLLGDAGLRPGRSGSKAMQAIAATIRVAQDDIIATATGAKRTTDIKSAQALRKTELSRAQISHEMQLTGIKRIQVGDQLVLDVNESQRQLSEGKRQTDVNVKQLAAELTTTRNKVGFEQERIIKDIGLEGRKRDLTIRRLDSLLGTEEQIAATRTEQIESIVELQKRVADLRATGVSATISKERERSADLVREIDTRAEDERTLLALEKERLTGERAIEVDRTAEALQALTDDLIYREAIGATTQTELRDIYDTTALEADARATYATGVTADIAKQKEIALARAGTDFEKAKIAFDYAAATTDQEKSRIGRETDYLATGRTLATDILQSSLISADAARTHKKAVIDQKTREAKLQNDAFLGPDPSLHPTPIAQDPTADGWTRPITEWVDIPVPAPGVLPRKGATFVDPGISALDVAAGLGGGALAGFGAAGAAKSLGWTAAATPIGWAVGIGSALWSIFG